VESNDRNGNHGRVCEGDRVHVGVSHGMVEVKLLCFRWLNLCRRGFQYLLKARSSSLLMLFGYISSSVATLMGRHMYPVVAERSFVSCSLIMWSLLMLCSATADLSGCASLICLVCSLIQSWMDRPALSNINPATFTWDPLYTRCS